MPQFILTPIDDHDRQTLATYLEQRSQIRNVHSNGIDTIDIMWDNNPENPRVIIQDNMNFFQLYSPDTNSITIIDAFKALRIDNHHIILDWSENNGNINNILDTPICSVHLHQITVYPGNWHYNEQYDNASSDSISDSISDTISDTTSYVTSYATTDLTYDV
jgi:hypothetical protein